METIDINGLANQIAKRAMEEARAFSGIGPVKTKGKLTATIVVPTGGWATVTRKRGRPLSARTLKAVDMMRGGARNKEVVKALGFSDSHVSHIRRRHIRKAA